MCPLHNIESMFHSFHFDFIFYKSKNANRTRIIRKYLHSLSFSVMTLQPVVYLGLRNCLAQCNLSRFISTSLFVQFSCTFTAPNFPFKYVDLSFYCALQCPGFRCVGENQQDQCLVKPLVGRMSLAPQILITTGKALVGLYEVLVYFWENFIGLLLIQPKYLHHTFISKWAHMHVSSAINAPK